MGYNAYHCRYSKDGLACSCSHMGRESHEINQGRHMDKATTNTKDTGDKTYKKANANTDRLAIR